MGRSSPAIAIALLILLAAGVAWAFGSMLGQRFGSGDVYPSYSTRRADPVGAKALFDALDQLPGVTCERNYRRLAKLTDARADAEALKIGARHGQTLVLLAVPGSAFEDGDALQAAPLVDFAAAGGRLILTINGSSDRLSVMGEAMEKRQQELREQRRKKDQEKMAREKEEEVRADKEKPQGQPTEPEPRKEEEDRDTGHDSDSKGRFKPTKSLRDLLHITIENHERREIPKGGYQIAVEQEAKTQLGSLPSWFSHAFVNLNPHAQKQDEKQEATDGVTDAPRELPEASAWRVLATVEGQPVLIERRVSHGSIVIATDSRFASNQELLVAPSPTFLAWLVGDARLVIFDETHLGTQENPGIMTLARRFRLQGFFIGGIVLFTLFVWQSSSSLVPPLDDSRSGRSVAGQGAVAGLVSLLRRGIPRSRLIQACFEQWERYHARPSAALQKRMEQARAMLPPPGRRVPRGELVRLYQRLCETIHPKRN
ncbi:MAG: hypothetical protein ACOYMN_02635 [Roseimicrobium sp.]